MNAKTSKLRDLALSVVSILCLISLWLVLSSSRPDFFPTPQMTWERFIELIEYPVSKVSILGHIWASLRRVVIAFCYAVVLGISLGIAMGWNKKIRAAVEPIFESLRPIPPIAWIPLVILWFGVGEFPKILLVFIGSFIPIVLNTMTGVALVDPMYLSVSRVFKANTLQTMIHVVLPASIPAIFAGMKASLSSGWMVVVAAEMIASKSGVGFLITRGSESYDVALILCGMILIGIVGALARRRADSSGKVALSVDNKERKVMLRLENIAKSFYARHEVFDAVSDVSIDVYENEFLTILGPGQCGKSVLLNIIAGLEKPTKGTVDFPASSDTTMGFVFQKTAVFPWKTVMENVELGLQIKGTNKKERREKAQYLIELVGLKGFENAYPYQLSGGMKQRVGIARAYCVNPDILLMDEPFGALDAQTGYQMEEEVLRIWQAEKRTVIFVTNNIEEALFLGDRIVLLSACPAKVKEIYIPRLERPRNNIDPDFLALREEIEANTDLAL